MLLATIIVLSVVGGGAVCLCTAAAYIHWLWMLPVFSLGCFMVLFFLAFLFLYLCCAVVDLNKPQLHDNKFYRGLAKLYIRAGCTILGVRFHKQGLENIPRDGRFLLVCNHLSDMDPISLLDAFPNSELAFISKRENSSMFIVGKMMHRLMCQMINRENDREALKTILKCISLLKEDEVNVAVFPEGYTSLNGRLQKFRPGVFKIALKAQVPIVICTLAGTEHVFHNALRLKKTDVKVHLVEVLPVEFLQGKTAVDVSNYVWDKMLKDLGPGYAPVEAPEEG